jgi:sulfane dehydrogenase subunit SoxC
MTRERFVPAGPGALSGRAWSGRAAVTRVEVSTDGGASWADADGATQPDEQEWNRQGMADNLVQRVPVTVLDPRS